MGEAALTEVRSEFEKRVNAGEFIGVEKRTGAPGRAFTTQEMIDYERDTIQIMREGQDKHCSRCQRQYTQGQSRRTILI